jgi:uncharacterized membrane protein
MVLPCSRLQRYGIIKIEPVQFLRFSHAGVHFRLGESVYMMIVKRSIDIAAPQQQVFDYVADHRNVPTFLRGVSHFRCINGKDHGLGSKFSWKLNVHGLGFEADFEVVEYQPSEWMAAETTRGPRSFSSWRLRTNESGGTEATFAVGYEWPNIPLVRFLGKPVVEREIAALIESSLKQLKSILESPIDAGVVSQKSTNGCP